MTAEETSIWKRRALEVGFWVLLISVLWTLDGMTKVQMRERTGVGLDDFRLITEQVTSGLAALAMVAFVSAWLRQFPLKRSAPLQTLVGHLVGSVLFAVGHYFLFVILRKIVFAINGMAYMPDQNHLRNLVFEYQKDLKIYIGMVAIIAAYRHFRSRREESEAPDPAAQEELTGRETIAEGRSPRKLVVQTRSGERLLDISEIDYLEAARNYVSVHSEGKVYLVRSPLNALLLRLPIGRFIRTHRSFLVNIDAITELQTLHPGHVLLLRTGAQVPVSRRYRDEVKETLDAMAV